MIMVKATWAGIKLLMAWIAAHLVYGYAAYQYPTFTRSVTRAARGVFDHLEQLQVPDHYMVWADLLLQPAALVILFIAVLLRILFSVIGSLVTAPFRRSDAGDV